MFNLYINSLYNLLVENHIFKLIWRDLVKGMMVWINLPRNLHFTANQQKYLEHRLQVIESYVQTEPVHRLDKIR